MLHHSLTGIRVLDFSGLVPGPFLTLAMADLGAEVVKVESPKGDPLRRYPPFHNGVSTRFSALHAGKKSIVLDLKSAEGLEKAKALIVTADVLVETFRPGVMERLGLDYETCQSLNPRLIYCSISGYGQEDPTPGHDLNFQALSGALAQTTPPTLPPSLSADLSASLWALSGTLAALYQRERTGKGQYIDIAMLSSAESLMIVEGDEENDPLHGGLAAYHLYETSDGHYMAVAALEPHFWELFNQTIGRTVESDDLTSQKKQPSLKNEIASIFRSKPRAHWEHCFANVNCCVTPVRSKQAKNTSSFPIGKRSSRPAPILGEHQTKL